MVPARANETDSVTGQDKPPSDLPDVAVLPRAVRRALDFMQSRLDGDLGIDEIAAASGLSTRALQRQFRTFLSKSPHQALSDIRFDAARRHLLLGRPGTRVMNVAKACGFSHFGRFSIAYGERYGETPSQTLRRQETLSDVVSARHQTFPAGNERPAMSIGPIEDASGRGDDRSGIAEEVAAALARGGIAATAHAGAARYHLAGSIKGAGSSQARLVFRLIDRQTGRHLWAHRIDGDWDGGAAFDEQLATRLAAALHPSLRAAEIDRAVHKERDITAQDLALRAMPGVLSLDERGNARAIELLCEAMARDPGNPLPPALAAWAYGQRVVYYFGVDHLKDRSLSAEYARKALSLPTDPTVLSIVGTALSLLNDERAEQVIARALAIDGGSAWAWGRSGWIDVYRGNNDSAIERFMIALELAPTDALAFNNLYGIGVAHFNAGRFRETALWQERALVEHPSLAWMHRTLCPAYMLVGAREQALDSARRLREGYPELTLTKATRGLPPLPHVSRERVVEALHGIGLPP